MTPPCGDAGDAIYKLKKNIAVLYCIRQFFFKNVSQLLNGLEQQAHQALNNILLSYRVSEEDDLRRSTRIGDQLPRLDPVCPRVSKGE